MSVPPDTEMFQFSGFASNAYVFSARYPSRGGLPHSDIHGSTPARGSPWLFAACHVLHRLLVPRHPPNALLALKITRPRPMKLTPHEPDLTHHAQEPATHRIAPARCRPRPWTGANSAHTRDRTGSHRPDPNAAERLRPVAGSHAGSLPRTCRSDNATKARPATHQNLIHPDKDHTARQTSRPGRQPPHRRHRRAPQDTTLPRNSGSHCDDTRRPPRHHQANTWWRRSDSNRRPPACKAGALPAELRPRTTPGSRRHRPGHSRPGRSRAGRRTGGPGRI